MSDPMTMRLPIATIRTQVEVPLRFADGFVTDARVFTFDGLVDDREHLAFALGDRTAPVPADERHVPLIRPHSECLTGDVFGSERCDCGPQLREAVERIADAGGYVLYLRQEGRGIGLYSKLDAYALQDAGADTYEANLALGHGEDERSYLAAAQMLHALGASRVALLSNNPDKARQLRSWGVTVVEQLPTGVYVSDANQRYLETKAHRGRHTLDLQGVLGSRSSDPLVAEPGATA
jgi:GTP cyclohydrolase II